MTPNEILAYGFLAFVLLTVTHSFAYRRGENSMVDKMQDELLNLYRGDK